MKKEFFHYFLENHLIYFFSFCLIRKNVKKTLSINELLAENRGKRRKKSFINYSCEFKEIFFEWVLMALRFGFFSHRFLFSRFYQKILHLFCIVRESYTKQLEFQKSKKKKHVSVFKNFPYFGYKNIFFYSRWCKTKRDLLSSCMWKFKNVQHTRWLNVNKAFICKIRRFKKGLFFAPIWEQSPVDSSCDFFSNKKLNLTASHFIRKYKKINWIRVKEVVGFPKVICQNSNSFFSIKLKIEKKNIFFNKTPSVKILFTESSPRKIEIQENLSLYFYELEAKNLTVKCSPFKQLYLYIFKKVKIFVEKKNQHLSKKRKKKDINLKSCKKPNFHVKEWDIGT